MAWGVLRHSRQKQEASPSLPRLYPVSSVTRGWPLLNWRSDSWTREVWSRGPTRPTAASPPTSDGREARARGRPPFLGGRLASKARRRLCGQRGRGTAKGHRLGLQGSPAGAPGGPPALLLWTRSFPEWLPRASREPDLGGLQPVSLCPPRGCAKPARPGPRGHADRQACCPGPSRSCSSPPLSSEFCIPSTSPSAPRMG